MAEQEQILLHGSAADPSSLRDGEGFDPVVMMSTQEPVEDPQTPDSDPGPMGSTDGDHSSSEEAPLVRAVDVPVPKGMVPVYLTTHPTGEAKAPGAQRKAKSKAKTKAKFKAKSKASGKAKAQAKAAVATSPGIVEPNLVIGNLAAPPPAPDNAALPPPLAPYNAAIPPPPAPRNAAQVAAQALSNEGIGSIRCGFCKEWCRDEKRRFRSKATMKWQCDQCKNVDQQTFRAFGSIKEVATWSDQDQEKFYSESKGQHPSVTKNAYLKVTKRYLIEEHTYAHDGEYLPLSVWKSRGFDSDLIEAEAEEADKRTYKQLGKCYRVKIFKVSDTTREGTDTSHSMTTEKLKRENGAAGKGAEAPSSSSNVQGAEAEGSAETPSSQSSSSPTTSSSTSSSYKKKKSKKFKKFKNTKKTKKNNKSKDKSAEKNKKRMDKLAAKVKLEKEIAKKEAQDNKAADKLNDIKKKTQRS